MEEFSLNTPCAIVLRLRYPSHHCCIWYPILVPQLDAVWDFGNSEVECHIEPLFSSRVLWHIAFRFLEFDSLLLLLVALRLS